MGMRDVTAGGTTPIPDQTSITDKSITKQSERETKINKATQELLKTVSDVGVMGVTDLKNKASQINSPKANETTNVFNEKVLLDSRKGRDKYIKLTQSAESRFAGVKNIVQSFYNEIKKYGMEGIKDANKASLLKEKTDLENKMVELPKSIAKLTENKEVLNKESGEKTKKNATEIQGLNTDISNIDSRLKELDPKLKQQDPKAILEKNDLDQKKDALTNKMDELTGTKQIKENDTKIKGLQTAMKTIQDRHKQLNPLGIAKEATKNATETFKTIFDEMCIAVAKDGSVVAAKDDNDAIKATIDCLIATLKGQGEEESETLKSEQKNLDLAGLIKHMENNIKVSDFDKKTVFDPKNKQTLSPEEKES